MFYGSHQTRVDEKGRLKMPAEYKRELEKQGKDFYITSEDGKRAQVYPVAEWECKMERLAQMPSTSITRRRFMDVTSYYGQLVEMDPQGRMLIPQELRDAARLTGDVRVLAANPIVEIVNNDEFKASLLQQPITDDDRNELAKYGV